MGIGGRASGGQWRGAQDTATAGLIPIWWDDGDSGNGSYSLFNRNTGAVTQTAIVNRS